MRSLITGKRSSYQNWGCHSAVHMASTSLPHRTRRVKAVDGEDCRAPLSTASHVSLLNSLLAQTSSTLPVHAAEP